ncbi:hypothetical protein [Sphingomonas nostoxanthinifaciens]|uniref:hypothetical protein n=1 Tax=Sphingomonas nostoxanthinifaciens TaxID=2872652 RepID=UPI001CC1FA1D|nr:hypothetical protein [Sphingomonas nostoxanthinifaciens]
MLAAMDFSATILRPTYFIDNEVMVKDVILQHGVYAMPIGGKGVASPRIPAASPRSRLASPGTLNYQVDHPNGAGQLAKKT